MTGVLPRVSAERVEQAVSSGTYLGVQLYVSVGTEVWADIAVGERIPGAAMGTDDSVPWSCCSKPLGALALGLLFEEGALTPETRVSSVLPEYGAGGKTDVTLAHLLSHSVPYNVEGEDNTPILHVPHEQALAIVCARSLVDPPGSRALYSPFGSWTVVAEIVARLTGAGFFDFVEREVLRPLEMREVTFGNARATARGPGSVSDLYLGGDEGFHVHPLLNVEEALRPGSPGSGAHGPARELARVFECLAHGGWWNGKRVLGQKAVRALSSTVRHGLPDPAFCDLDLRWGLGFCTDNALFSAPRGARLVGHTGFRCALAIGDLDRRIVIAFLSTSVTDGALGRGRLVAQIVRDVYAAVDAGHR